MRVEFRVLGPLEASCDGVVLPVSSGRQRTVLATLLLHANRVVAVDDLAEALWGSALPPSARVTVQNYVKRLRDALGEAGRRVVTQPPGYLIRVAPDEVDVSLLEVHLDSARTAAAAGSWESAAVKSRAALLLWRGEPLADVPSEYLALREVRRLADMRMQATEIGIEAALRLGRHAAVIGELRRLVASDPLRERLSALLMAALYADGRQAEALAVYQQARDVLIAELGVEPGHELRAVHQHMLTGGQALHGLASRPAMAATGRGAVDALEMPRQLPAAVGCFTGRARELTALSGLLGRGSGAAAQTMVISAIGGTAGVGKTALAIEWAHQVAGEFPDGQLYVNLRGYDPGQPLAPGEALAGFLAALGVPGPQIPPGQDERASWYRSLLAGRRMLVVLDNAGDPEQVRPLLPGEPGCLVVVTSRDMLAGLVAHDGARRLELDLLPLADAVGLLRALIGGRVDDEPAAAEELAARCARLPLALRVAAELAAARPAVSLTELAAELSDPQRRLDLLDACQDQRTAVRVVLSWSYGQLSADAARMFRLAGLHSGPDLDVCAAAALTGSTVEHSGRLLGQLARAHLIQPAEPGRYGMHDLLRDYAAGVSAAEDGDQIRNVCLTRLFDYYLCTAAAAADTMFPADHDRRAGLPELAACSPPVADRAAALAWLDAERAVLVSVAEYSSEHGWPGHAVGLAAALSRYLNFGVHIVEAVAIHGYARSAALQTGDRRGEAMALVGLGGAELQRGRYRAARECLQQAQALFGDIGDLAGEARVLSNFGGIDLAEGLSHDAAKRLERAVVLNRQAGNQVAQARALANLSMVDLLLGWRPRAVDHLRQALALSRQVGDDALQAHIRHNLGDVYLQQRRYHEAAEQLRQALALAGPSGNRQVETDALTNLGLAELGQGRSDMARSYLEKALQQAHAAGDLTAQANALTGLGEVLLAAGQPTAARSMHNAALALASQTEKCGQARAHDGIARCYEASGHVEKARLHWYNALQLYTEAGAGAAEQIRARLGPAKPGRSSQVL